MDLTAARTFVNDDIAFFWVGYNLNGLHRSLTFARSVTGIYVEV